jgi:hypothetical protein
MPNMPIKPKKRAVAIPIARAMDIDARIGRRNPSAWITPIAEREISKLKLLRAVDSGLEPV